MRAVIRGLRNAVPFLYLPDMDFGPKDSLFVPFFGVPTATVTALSRLASMTGARVVPCITRQLPGAGGYVARALAYGVGALGDERVREFLRRTLASKLAKLDVATLGASLLVVFNGLRLLRK